MTKAQILRQIDEQYQGDTAFWDASTVDPADDDAPPVPEGVSVAAVQDGILIQVDFHADKAHMFPRFQEFIVYARPIGTDIDDGSAVEVCRFSGSTKVWQQTFGGYQGWDVALTAVTNNEIESDKTDFYPVIVSTFYDDFRRYGGSTLSLIESLYHLEVADADSDETWTVTWAGAITDEVDNFKEGDGAKRATAAGGPPATADMRYDRVMDLSQEGRFGDDDYVIVSYYISDNFAGLVHFRLGESGVVYFFWESSYWAYCQQGWHHLIVKKSDFTNYGGADWANITYILAYTQQTAGEYFILDDWRIVKASALDPAGYSDTGDAWLPTGGWWHLYPGDRPGEPPGFNYGQIRSTAAEWLFSIARQIGVVNGRMSARLRVQYADGLAGVVFRSATDASNCLAVVLDTAAGKIWLVQWTGGGLEAVTNMALNPSAEAAGNFGALAGATVTAETDHALFGSQSFKIVTTATIGDGMTATVSALSNADHYVTFYVLSGDPGPELLEVSVDGGSNWNACQFLEGRLGWARYEAFIPAAQANGSTELDIRQNDDTDRTFYVDGILATTVEDAAYCDGDQGLHHTWSGTAHASTSSRPAGTPATVASADYSLDHDTDYHLGVDFRDDANERRVIVTIGTAAAALWTAGALVLSATTLELWPVETGVGLVCYDCNARWGEVRAGSPQTADFAHRAAVADALSSPVLAFFPTGAILETLSDTPPDGWLLCDGSAVSRTTYAGLYALIGDTFGNGDGSTTFNLPDLLPHPIPCVPPLEADGWNGDAKGAGNTAIDLSAEFGLPAGIRGIQAQLGVVDNTSTSNYSIGPDTSHYYDVVVYCTVTDKYTYNNGYCNCDANGDIVFNASAAPTAVWLRITAYYYGWVHVKT